MRHLRSGDTGGARARPSGPPRGADAGRRDATIAKRFATSVGKTGMKAVTSVEDVTTAEDVKTAGGAVATAAASRIAT